MYSVEKSCVEAGSCDLCVCVVLWFSLSIMSSKSLELSAIQHLWLCSCMLCGARLSSKAFAQMWSRSGRSVLNARLRACDRVLRGVLLEPATKRQLTGDLCALRFA